MGYTYYEETPEGSSGVNPWGRSSESYWENHGLGKKLEGKTLAERGRILTSELGGQGVSGEYFSYLLKLTETHGLVKPGDLEKLLLDVNIGRKEFCEGARLDEEGLNYQIMVELDGKDDEIVTYMGLSERLKKGTWMDVTKLGKVLSARKRLELEGSHIRRVLNKHKSDFELKKHKGKYVAYVTVENIGLFELYYERPE